jgi:hypothetical protein
MTARPVPARHFRSYGDAPLPAAAEALARPFSAFPSWFLRIECDRCGKTTNAERAAHLSTTPRPADSRTPRQAAP